ncbi:hypothetical protein [uncultured Endozoicomonas sp.]|uniref:hypothetical protein n=1 Tax=uncultured Endozoicomonas sp. TaxID=432652 RepID=UPI00261CB8CB|nr:hypothetical protein [uncultured Endozoicomonas sp.]
MHLTLLKKLLTLGLTLLLGLSANGHSESPISYEHMALYQLKSHRYNAQTAIIESEKKYPAHSGWYPLSWCTTCYTNSNTDNDDQSLSDTNTDGLEVLGIAIVVTAIVAGSAYATYYATKPYQGAASLTAVELPEDSPWKITNYKIIHGRVIKEADFFFDEEALATVINQGMFDKTRNNAGRFLLVDQENWWGLVGYPMDINITLSSAHEASEENKNIVVNIKRSITNGIKAGTITATIVNAPDIQQPIYLKKHIDYPGWLEFSNWQAKPARLLLDVIYD